MKRIGIITTGGTIAMKEDIANRSVLPQRTDTLRKVLPLLDGYAQVTMEHLLNLPSPHLTPGDMYTIAVRVHELLHRFDMDGVVITHGTDTLEETAYFLDLVVPGDKPIVLTGAMRSQGELGADGPSNLVSAVRVAAEGRSRGRGALVVFNDEIHAARRVTKTHTSNIATFQSPGYGPEGSVTKGRVRYFRPLTRENLFPLQKPRHRVELIKAVAGADDLFVLAALESRVQGLVIEGLGQGNLPPQMLPGVQKILARNIPVVLVSRCYNGFVEATYGYEGGGKHLKEMGVFLSNGLNGQKARIRLMAALEDTQDREELRYYFQERDEN